MNKGTNPDLARKLYAMYLRKSRADLELEALGEGETLAKHKDRLYTLADRLGIPPSQIVVYQEIVSGESIQDRPEMLRLLDDVYAKKYAGVLVVEVERLARGNTRDQGEVADAFTYSDTKIITPVKIYDPHDEYDQEYFEFGLFMSRREYKTHQRRMAAGKEAAVRAGNYIGSVPPYGFTIVKRAKNDRILVENPDESKYVKMVFDWFTEDRKSVGWIANQLNLIKAPTRTGKEWMPRIVSRMITNYHYIGKIMWGYLRTTKERDPETGKIGKKRKVTGAPEIYEGKHRGFISEEQFNKAQSLYGTSAPVKVNKEMLNPLAGMLHCKTCGYAIFVGTSGPTRAKRFMHPYGRKCIKPSCTVPVLMEALINTIKAYIADYELKMKHGEKDNSVERHTAMIAAMEAELAKLQSRKRKLMDSWEADDGMYTREEYLERKQMYNEGIDRLSAQIAKEKENAPVPVDYAEKLVALHAMLDCINNTTISVKAKNRFLRQFIEDITYDVIVEPGQKNAPILEVLLK